jgi:transposase
VSLLQRPLEPSTLVLAVDPGKVSNRVWLSDGFGLLAEPVSMPVSRAGLTVVERLVSSHDAGHPAVVVAIEATGSLHRAWSSALERSYPGAVRLFAPSETKAARTQLGSGRFKTDDRDCAALTYLARQGAGRRWVDEVDVDALRAVVRHRRGLVHDRKVIQQRLQDQLNALAPGLSAPAGHGRSLALDQPFGSGSVGLRGRVRWPATDGAVTASSSHRTLQPSRRGVLGTAVAGLPATAARCGAEGGAAGPRPRSAPSTTG